MWFSQIELLNVLLTNEIAEKRGRYKKKEKKGNHFFARKEVAELGWRYEDARLRRGGKKNLRLLEKILRFSKKKKNT